MKSVNGSTILFNRVPRIECEDMTIKVGEDINIFDYIVAYDEDNNPVGKENIIISKNNLDTSKAGTYEVIVEVNDRTNTFRVQNTIKITVKTNNKPIIIGADNIEIPVNEVFDPLYGVIATDKEDGVITNKIEINGFLNVCKMGTYILSYSVTDSDNNTTIVKRNISVIENTKPKISVEDTNINTSENIKENIQEATESVVNLNNTPTNQNINSYNKGQYRNNNNTIIEEEKVDQEEEINDSKEKKKKSKGKKKKSKKKKGKPKKLSRKEKRRIKKEEKIRAKQEKKALKEEYKKIDKDTFDLLPFLEIAEDETFKTKNGFIDIFQIGTKDLNSLNNDDAHRHIMDFSNFLRNYIDDIKIISMTFPVNTQVQQEHILKKMEMTDNKIYINFLNKRLDQLIAIEEKRKNKEFYLMVFYEDEKTKREREIQLLRLTSSAITLSTLDLDKKIKIIFKLNNQNSKI